MTRAAYGFIYMNSDPLFSFQSYLSGKYEIGSHSFGDWSPVLDIGTVWKDYKGEGVTVGVLRPVDRLHPDLVANYDTSLITVSDPLDALFEGTNGYGTALAGLAVADDDGQGIVGVAPDAGLQSIEGVAAGTVDVVIALADFDGMYTSHLLSSMGDNRNGLGEIIVTTSPGDSHFYILGHIAGTLNSEFGLTAQRNTVTVEGLTAVGFPANFPSNIAGGDMTLVSVMMDTASYLHPTSPDIYDPSSIYYVPPENRLPDLSGLEASEDVPKTLTIDPRGSLGFNDSTNGIWEILVNLAANGGPSAFDLPPNARIENSGDYWVSDDPQLAAGIAGGLVALILEANPGLGWRDVQEILAYSAQQHGVYDNILREDLDVQEEWRINDATNWNAGGLIHSAVHGFGAIDIRAAVRLAETWEGGNTWNNEDSLMATANFTIPQGGEEFSLYDGFFTPNISKEYTFSVQNDFEIEHVELHLRYTTPGRDSEFDDLPDTPRYYDHAKAKIELISPTGLISTLSGHNESYFGLEEWVDHGFTSRLFWGSNAAVGSGDWTVRFTNDSFLDVDLTVEEVELTFYGRAADQDDKYIFTNDFETMAGLGRDLTIDDTSGVNEINASPVLADLVLTTAAGAIATADGKPLYQLSGSSVIDKLYAGDGDDKLLGTNRGEIFYGGRGDDEISAGSGNDIVEGGAGDDYMNGGGGGDQARFEHNLSAYSISTDANGFTTFTTTAGGVLERDVTVNVEYFRFADRTIQLSDLPGGGSAPKVSDLTGDGRADLLFFNPSTRGLGMIDMIDKSWASLGKAGSGWEALAVADVEGDGASDVIWFNTGTKAVGRFDFEANGSVAWRGIGQAGGAWEIAGTGDFDGDGDHDILWANNATNSAGYYRMEGGSASWRNLGATGDNWSVAGAGDFNGDGVDDILWYNSQSGALGQFRMDAFGSKSWAAITTLGAGWRVADAGDFDGDLVDDILVFQASSGRVGQFDMSSGSAAWADIGEGGAGWTVQGAADFNGDGRSDILWRNRFTDEVGQFSMTETGYDWDSITIAGSAWDVLL